MSKIKFRIAIVLLLVPLAFGAQDIRITGTLSDDQNVPAKNVIIEAYPLDEGISGGLANRVRTDEQGRFTFVVQAGRTPDGRSYGLKWGLYPHDEDAYYPDLSSWFYTTAAAHWTEIQIPEGEKTEIIVPLKLSPKAAAIVGTVTDAVTGAAVKAEFVFAHSSETRNQMGGSWPSTYHILIPSNTDILLTVIANGYSPWSYPGALNLRPGSEIKLTIHLQ